MSLSLELHSFTLTYDYTGYNYHIILLLIDQSFNDCTYYVTVSAFVRHVF